MLDSKDTIYLEIARDLLIAFSSQIHIKGESPEGYGQNIGQIFNLIAREVKRADMDLKKVKAE